MMIEAPRTEATRWLPPREGVAFASLVTGCIVNVVIKFYGEKIFSRFAIEFCFGSERTGYQPTCGVTVTFYTLVHKTTFRGVPN